MDGSSYRDGDSASSILCVCRVVWRGAAPCPGTVRAMVNLQWLELFRREHCSDSVGSSYRRELLRIQCAECLSCSLRTCGTNPLLVLVSRIVLLCL